MAAGTRPVIGFTVYNLRNASPPPLQTLDCRSWWGGPSSAQVRGALCHHNPTGPDGVSGLEGACRNPKAPYYVRGGESHTPATSAWLDMATAECTRAGLLGPYRRRAQRICIFDRWAVPCTQCPMFTQHAAVSQGGPVQGEVAYTWNVLRVARKHVRKKHVQRNTFGRNSI